MPNQPLPRPHRSRLLHQQRSQNHRLPNNHGQLRSFQQGIRKLVQGSETFSDLYCGTPIAFADGCRDRGDCSFVGMMIFLRYLKCGDVSVGADVER